MGLPGFRSETSGFQDESSARTSKARAQVRLLLDVRRLSAPPQRMPDAREAH